MIPKKAKEPSGSEWVAKRWFGDADSYETSKEQLAKLINEYQKALENSQRVVDGNNRVDEVKLSAREPKASKKKVPPPVVIFVVTDDKGATFTFTDKSELTDFFSKRSANLESYECEYSVYTLSGKKIHKRTIVIEDEDVGLQGGEAV